VFPPHSFSRAQLKGATSTAQRRRPARRLTPASRRDAGRRYDARLIVGERLADGVRKAIRERAHLMTVLAFDHDPDYGLGAGRA
jgi:hypothetical protein